MLDPEIKAKWVAALRSGNYKQGLHYLKRRVARKDQYCCLGVLCEVLGVPSEGPNRNGVSTYEGLACVLPVHIVERVGLLDDVASLQGSPQSLSSMNDHGASFEEIAKVIEEKF